MENELVVTKVTQHATQDPLTAADYRDIYEERRNYNATTGRYAISLDDFVTLIGSQYSKASWSKYHNGQLDLNRTMRNELRAAVGQPCLPLTLTEAMYEVDPDAEVVRIGDDVPARVVIIGTRRALVITSAEQVSATLVTEVTRQRKRVVRPWITEEQAAQQAKLGVCWREIINTGLRVLITNMK